jgi:hypothetical protein
MAASSSAKLGFGSARESHRGLIIALWSLTSLVVLAVAVLGTQYVQLRTRFGDFALGATESEVVAAIGEPRLVAPAARLSQFHPFSCEASVGNEPIQGVSKVFVWTSLDFLAAVGVDQNGSIVAKCSVVA